jgi:predicted RecB family nuclease
MTQPTSNIGSVQPNSALDLRVDPQGAYLARKCREAIQLDILSPVSPLPVSDFFAKIGEEGSTYEEEVFELLRSEIPGVEYIPPNLDSDLREELTLECLNAGVTLILGGRLPTDFEAHRAGEPDMLVRASDHIGPSGKWEYRAVDVKGHLVYSQTSEPAEDLTSLLLLDPSAVKDDAEETRPRCNLRDVSQLAHYQRMLEASGHAAPVGRWGGIVGREFRLAWYDLDAKSGDAIISEDGHADRRSFMEIYDLQFEDRLKVIDRANAHKEDPSFALLAEPVLNPDCPTCCWREFCVERLEESADLSLIRGVDYAKRRQHHDLGTMDLHDLARLDYPTAKLLTKHKVDLLGLRTLAAEVDPSTPIAEIIPRKRGKISNLAALGFNRASDLSRLDERTLRYAGTGMNDLAEQIDLAKARVGPGAVYRKRGLDVMQVPRADVEIDVDMESIDGGAYLWGVLVTERMAGNTSDPEYKSFVSWDRPIQSARVEAFKEFWAWLCWQRQQCAESNRTLRAYCFSKGAENTQMKRDASALGLEDSINEFLESDQWVDLLEVVRRQLVTGDSMGLKGVAPLAGFSWRDDDSGGMQAIVRYDEASATYDSVVRDEARRWLLDYNEDDVRATKALREWLDGDARELPSVEDLCF